MLKVWLQRALTNAAVNQAELARRLSETLGRYVDRAAVNKMLSGERRMLADEMLGIAQVLNCSLPTFDASKTESQLEVITSQIQVALIEADEQNIIEPADDSDMLQIEIAVLLRIAAQSLANDFHDPALAQICAENIVTMIKNRINTDGDYRPIYLIQDS